MKTAVIIGLLLAGLTVPATAQYQTSPYGSGYGTGSNPNNHRVEGYTRDNGTYVQPHYQTNPNNTVRDNYGTSPNYNPYTNSYGTRNPYGR